MYSLFGRFEAVQVETALVLTGAVADGPAAETRSPVLALTAGGVRDLVNWHGFEGGIGADVSFYGVPGALQPVYSPHPISWHIFFRLRPPAGSMGRMTNMRMSQPMTGHKTAMPMNHQMP
jgi:hypothetical protein